MEVGVGMELTGQLLLPVEDSTLCQRQVEYGLSALVGLLVYLIIVEVVGSL
jgi:hypothetical protein